MLDLMYLLFNLDAVVALVRKVGKLLARHITSRPEAHHV